MCPNENAANVVFLKREIHETPHVWLGKVFSPLLPELDPICVMGSKAAGCTKQVITDALDEECRKIFGEDFKWSDG